MIYSKSYSLFIASMSLFLYHINPKFIESLLYSQAYNFSAMSKNVSFNSQKKQKFKKRDSMRKIYTPYE